MPDRVALPAAVLLCRPAAGTVLGCPLSWS